MIKSNTIKAERYINFKTQTNFKAKLLTKTTQDVLESTSGKPKISMSRIGKFKLLFTLYLIQCFIKDFNFNFQLSFLPLVEMTQQSSGLLLKQCT